MLLLASVASAQDIRVRTNFNTRLRQAPDATSIILATIPRRTTLVAEALSVDKGWIQVTYQGQKGWIAARLVDFLAPSTPRPARAQAPVLAGNWTLELTGAFSCLSLQEAINVPNFRETVVLTPLNRFTALQITGPRFTQGRTVTMGVSGTAPLTYVGTFPFVLGNSADSAVEVTFVFGFEVKNNRSLQGLLTNVTVKQGGQTFTCTNGDYKATLTKQ